MYQITVVPDYNDICGLYGRFDVWKDYVCENFDENVVILGQYGQGSLELASWWSPVRDVLDALEECDGEDADGFLDYCNDCYWSDAIGESKLLACWRLSQAPGFDITDLSDVLDLVELINPNLSFQVGKIYGSVQGEQADVLYIENSIDLERLADFYFGNVYVISVYEVTPEDDDYWGSERLLDYVLIGGSEVAGMSESQIISFVRDNCYAIPEGAEVEVLSEE